jgi:hypothetical protein
MCNKDNQARCALMLRELLQVDPARVEFVDQERRNVLMFVQGRQGCAAIAADQMAVFAPCIL